MFLCSRCHKPRERTNQRYCQRCHAEYMRRYRQVVAERKASRYLTIDDLAAKWLAKREEL